MAGARSFLGAGDIYIDRIVNGVRQGLVGKIYADKMQITPKVTTKQSTSKGKTDYGQVLETVNVADPCEFTLDLKEVTGDILTLAFLGTSVSATQASGSLAETSFTLHTGKWTELGHESFTDVVVKNSAGSTTYVEGTDYEVNADRGWVRAISGGGIADGTSVKIHGDYDAVSSTVISGQTNVDVRARIIFDGINQADGSQCVVEIFEAVIAANSAFDFLADNFGNVSLTGTLKTPSNQAAPFTVKTISAA